MKDLYFSDTQPVTHRMSNKQNQSSYFLPPLPSVLPCLARTHKLIDCFQHALLLLMLVPDFQRRLRKKPLQLVHILNYILEGADQHNHQEGKNTHYINI